MLINSKTNEISGVALNPKVLEFDTFKKIIGDAATDISLCQFTLIGDSPSKIISNNLLKEIGKLPEDKKESMISILIDAIPSNVNTVILQHPIQITIKKLSVQELTAIVDIHKDNQEAWYSMIADLPRPKGKTRFQTQLSSKSVRESIATETKDPQEELTNTEIVIQLSSKF